MERNTTRYCAENGWYTAKNEELKWCSNRQIYCANTNIQVLAGDFPIIRLSHARNLLGTLRLFIIGDEERIYLDDVPTITFSYRPNRVKWDIDVKELDTMSLRKRFSK